MRNRIIIALCVLIFVLMLPIKAFSYAIPPDSIERKHKTTTTCILKQTAIYGTEQLGGLVGFYGGLSTSCIWFCIAHWFGLIAKQHLTEIVYIGVTIATATTPIGTSYAGKLLGQRGSFTGALIGSAIGTAAWVIPRELRYLREGEYTDTGPPALWYVSIGSVIGYNYREILKLDACSIGGMLLTGVISYALPYLVQHLSTIHW